MSITISEAMQRVTAAGGRLYLEEPSGERTDVVPDPELEAAAGDWGPPYLDPPFPAPALSGVPVPSRLGDPLPFTPIIVTDDDLLPE